MKAIILAALMMPGAAFANVEIIFTEGAPKDRFELINTSGCNTGPLGVEIDMTQSTGGLYFDVSSAGAGVEVFQPFEIVAGAEYIGNTVQVRDGETGLRMDLSDLPAGERVAFTIDVDDTLRHGALGQTQVAGSEIAGTSVRVSTAAATELGVIDNTARGVVRLTTCSS